MVELTNLWIIVSKDCKCYDPLSKYLVIGERLRDGTLASYPLYSKNSYTESIYIPLGLLSFIYDIISDETISDGRSKGYIDSVSIADIEKYKNILDGITLKKEQLVAVRKILNNKRCIIQMGTGGGKSEIMCATTKILSDIIGYIPTTLVIEPTSRLVVDMTDRFKRYGIPVTMYNKNREIVDNHVNICHPKSLGNDIDRDPDLLKSVEVMFGDEAHHLASQSFRKPTYHMPNLIYSIGLSASIISKEHIGLENITDYTYREALAIGATGPLVLNVNTGSMISRDGLANPVLAILKNPATENIHTNDITNWHAISKYRLESDHRNKLVVDAANIFYMAGRKVLILVNTKRWAHKLLERLHKIGLSDISRASFGGGVFERYNGHDFENDTSNVYEKYNEGKISILIGTSHIYEGADIPNLDVIILAYGGRAERLQIQGIGRGLRKSKTGKYAWIVDFDDYNDVVLSSQYRKRLERYTEVIGVPPNRILYDLNIADLANAFIDLESLDIDVSETLRRYYL